MMYTLNLEHSFSAAHQLTNAYDNKCNASIHGHNWRIIVIIKTNQLINSMVCDFTKIKEIINRLDHTNLNELFDFEPTAENIATWLQDKIFIETQKNRNCYQVELTIYEAEKASITCSI